MRLRSPTSTRTERRTQPTATRALDVSVIVARTHGAFRGLFFILVLIALVLTIFVVVDIARRPEWQWQQSRSNKALWIVLQVVLFLLVFPASYVSGIIYLVSVRPKLVAAEQSGQVTGGYGGWGSQGTGTYSTPPVDPFGPPPGYGTPGSYGDAGSYGGAGSSGTQGPSGTSEETSAGPPRYPTAGGPGPSEATSSQVPPSWQADPTRRHELRYWDGTTWTEHVSDGGQQSTDPPVP
jgi:hypothetical protein